MKQLAWRRSLSGCLLAALAACTGPTASTATPLVRPRRRTRVPSGELDQREGPVPAGRDQEVLAPGGREEPLQTVVVILAIEVLLLEVLGRRRGARIWASSSASRLGSDSRCGMWELARACGSRLK
jgi:hypothetical protein